MFCVPHACGGAHHHLSWAAALGPGIEWVPVDRAGRFTRDDEPAPATFDDAMLDLTERIAAAGAGRRVALVGHSLGGVLAFETARRLRARDVDLTGLVVSGAEPLLRHLAELRPAGAATPVARQLLVSALPSIRADYRLHHSHVPDATASVDVPLLACRGTSDSVSEQAVEGWRRHSTAGVTVRHLPGGHFHWMADHRPLAHLVRAALSEGAACPR